MNSASIEDVTEFVLDGTHGSPARTATGIPVLSAQNVRNGALDYDTDRHTSTAEYEDFKRRLPLATGDVLLTIVGTIGRAAVVNAVHPLVFQRSVAVLRPRSDRLCSRFLYHVTQSQAFQAQLSRSSNQSSQAGVYLGKLKKLRIPLPPLPEQRRIAEILDKADTLRAKRSTTVTLLDTLAQSIFRDRFVKTLDGPAVDFARKRSGVPSGWSWELLTDVARLATGHTPDRERRDYWGGDIPWISLTDIRELDGTVAKGTLQNVTSLGIDNSSSVKLPAGTVCFSRTASVGFVTVMGREMATSQDFVNWVCGPALTPSYLLWALLDARKRLRALSSGSTHKTIYMRVVEQFRVLVPPIELQREFSEVVERIENTRIAFRSAMVGLDSLFGSLHARAFAGEL